MCWHFFFVLADCMIFALDFIIKGTLYIMSIISYMNVVLTSLYIVGNIEFCLVIILINVSIIS